MDFVYRIAIIVSNRVATFFGFSLLDVCMERLWITEVYFSVEPAA